MRGEMTINCRIRLLVAYGSSLFFAVGCSKHKALHSEAEAIKAEVETMRLQIQAVDADLRGVSAFVKNASVASLQDEFAASELELQKLDDEIRIWTDRAEVKNVLKERVLRYRQTHLGF